MGFFNEKQLHDNTMNVVVTIATGSTDFGNMALNLCLSIKANDKNQKVGLIYTEDAIKGIEGLISDNFDYGYRIFYDGCKTANELAFKTKTHLLDYCHGMCPDAESIIFLDADTILLPDKYASDWFEKHKDLNFTSYCNDMYYYSTKTRKRKDYTFWCDPEMANKFFEFHPSAKLPQINSSFLYFKPKSADAIKLFDTAKEIWEVDFDGLKLYKGEKPDEFCFNIACAITGIYPHKNTYRPLFFQCFTSTTSHEYIHHYFNGFGFAGNAGYAKHLIDLYNEHANYYREYFSISNKWIFEKETKTFVDDSQIKILPFRRRTLYREGDLPNSDAGVFNPDGIVLPDRTRMTIYRKEKSFDSYNMYAKNTAIAHVHLLKEKGEEEYELVPEGFDDGERIEDFRLFMCDKAIFCNHNVVTNNHTPMMEVRVNLSYIQGNKLVTCGTPNLPVEYNKIQKNWVFFGEGKRMWCIYSLSPYRLFYSDAETGWGEWYEYPVEQPEISFVHKGFISNSTNPILLGDEYLMFFHTKELGVYYKGAVIIDAATKKITHYTKHSIPFNARNDGWQKGLHYVSGLMYLDSEDAVRIYFGENDSHSGCFDYKREELLNAIKCQ